MRLSCICFLLILLTACASSPSTVVPLGTITIRLESIADEIHDTHHIRADTSRLIAHARWLPETAGFSASVHQPVDGQLLITGKRLLWGRPDARSSALRIGRSIAFDEIRSIALAERGAQLLIVIQDSASRHDSFSIGEPHSSNADIAATLAAYRYLLARLDLE